MSVVEFVAPRKVYIDQRRDVTERLDSNGYSLGQPLGLTKTKTGGLATWFAGHPFPRKTFIYPGVIKENNKAKRISLALFLPFASLRRGLLAFIESYILNFTRLLDVVYADGEQIPYLHYQYYSEFGKVIRDFTYLFLRKLGIKSEIAYRFGLQLATMIEYDDAYKVRLQDIANEIDKESLLKTPRKEILRVLELYKQRDSFDENNLMHAGARITELAKMGSLILYIPKVKKAFRFALENVNFEWVKLDEWDYYWTLNRGDYNCNGRPFEERKEEQIRMMIEFTKETNPGKVVERVEIDGVINIIAK